MITVKDIKLFLSAGASNYSDELIHACILQTKQEIELFTKRIISENSCEFDSIIIQVCVLKLNRLGTEGLNSQSFSGISESFIDGYPENIVSILKEKRKIKML